MVRREIKVMSDLRHPSLINVHDAYEDTQEVVIIYEL
jgi:serine/threonine protein kinase